MRKSQSGLSVFELSVSILVAAFVLFSVFQVIASGMRYQAHSRVSTRLAALLQKAMVSAKSDALQRGLSGQPLPASPPGIQNFAPPDRAYRFDVHFFTYAPVYFPPDAPNPFQTMYIIAVQVIVDGPVEFDGSAMTGYNSVNAVELLHYPVYQGSTPPINDNMPVSLHPPPPAPMIPVGMPSPLKN